ncbi:MAG: replicative DNA helicase [SAR202 cluster bacterium]|nr:replicative DNA helicase [SAR202 cluster bacterium]
MYQERLQPHDVEAEEAVIGSLLIDSEAILKVVHLLKPEDFYRERNAFCYEACIALFQRREAVNQVTVTHELGLKSRLDPVGGAAYLSHLVSAVPTSVHVEHYARIVARTATMRRLIRAASEIAAMGYDGTSDEVATLNRAENLLFGVRSGHAGREFVALREILDQYLEERSALVEPNVKIKAPVATGFDSMDEVLGGLQPSDLLILAARPSVGKSTLAVNMAVSAAKGESTVGIFSLEMSKEQLALRILASESRVETQFLRRGLYSAEDEQRIISAIGGLSELAIYIDDTPLQGIMEMRAKARRLHMERNLDLLVVDYLQLISMEGSRGSNRVQEISEISRALKGLARDLNIPVLAVSQLSRAVEMRPTHRPQLSDLRESGSIEQDADVVMFIYREDLYVTEEEWMQRHPEGTIYPRNVAEIIIAKHRHGPTDTFKLLFNNRLVRFEPAPLDLEYASP